ncbi:MAG: 3'(2'),5'-bisphosphate nucleotidase CysQ [Alphaproteobacteria bacterium]|nr:3'(2'),5'-bisphosphate nucleotidase CysQ [Alphaproteobacteria bacterium]
MLPDVLACTREAGDILLSLYRTDLAVSRKDDHSPVTEADQKADAHIVAALLRLTPNIPVISEEGDLPEDFSQEALERFWLVDPLDGTRSFLKGTGQFTVNIALIEAGVPVLGSILIPTENMLYYGVPGHGSFREKNGNKAEPIQARRQSAKGLDVVVSHSHLTPETEAYLAPIPVASRVSAASSLKFCVVAEGKADLYPRFGPTMEWDTAAGHAILLAAGGAVETPYGAPLLYNKHGFRNPPFIATGIKPPLPEPAGVPVDPFAPFYPKN